MHGGLRGSGDTKYIAKYTILADAIFRTLLAYIFVNIFDFNLVAIWFIILLDEVFKAIVFYKRFYSSKWENIRVI